MHPALHWFCMQYVKQKEDADEIVNDAFISLWEKRDTINFDLSIKSYLYTIVKNKSLNHLKKKNILIDSDDAESYHIISNEISPLQKIESKEMEQLIFKSIDKLPRKCRQIFILSRKEQMSHKEIAQIMDINIKTVENQITIAIKNIKSHIQKNESLTNTKDKPYNLSLLIFILLDNFY